MKTKKNRQTNGKTVASLRREVARLNGIVKAKNNADAARENLVNIMNENNATTITPFLLANNGWEACYDNVLSAEFVKGAFFMKFYKHPHIANKCEFCGNFRDNRIELRKPTITVGEVNTIMQMFGSTERLHTNTTKF